MGLVPRGQVVLDGRQVHVSAYSLDLRPVTNAEFSTFLQATGCDSPPWLHQVGFDAHMQPVVGVTYHDAQAYAAWAGKRLPTEAEWLRAARSDHSWDTPWGNSAPDVGRCDYGASSHRAPSEVEPLSRPLGCGPFGHHDLLGSVWEWCEGSVLRGGFWGADKPSLRQRLVESAERRSSGYGFRCAR
jgi:formylglycine-generating enzyme required for sulfatase activity